MSQAIENVVTNPAEGNGETAMRQALRAAVQGVKANTGKAKPATAGKTKPATTTPQRSNPDQRAPITLADAAALCAHQGLAENLARTFGLDGIDMATIKADTDASIRQNAEALAGALNERALAIHLQRIVGAFVGSAYGAGRFYSDKASEARQLTARLSDDAGESDRDGPAGFESKAQRARSFAAEMGLQSAALLAAAEGAADAFAHIIGEVWKPYDGRRQDNTRTVSRRAAMEQMEAFNR